MSTLLVPWVAFPLLFVALSWGCGLLLERVSGLKPAGSARRPVRLRRRRARRAVRGADGCHGRARDARRDRGGSGGLRDRPAVARPARGFGWAIASGVGAFAAYAAPIVLSGAATFAGYIKLDDDSTLTALVDRAMEHGRSVDGLEFSTYYRVVDLLLDEGYPLASLLPLGIGHEIVRSDALWLYQPAMAVMAAMLALGLYALAGHVVETRWLRALAAVVGAQSALLYGYALWGGIKEMGTAWALPVLAALVPLAARSERLRHLMPLAAVSALLLGVLNAGALVWLAPALGACLVLVVREHGLRGAVRPTAAFIGFLAAFALPTIVAAPAFLTSNIVSFDPIANLGAPLNPIQMAGIWPAGDFRVDPDLGRCDEGADPRRRHRSRCHGRVDAAAAVLGVADLRARRRRQRGGALDLEHAVDRGQGLRHRGAGHPVRRRRRRGAAPGEGTRRRGRGAGGGRGRRRALVERAPVPRRLARAPRAAGRAVRHRGALRRATGLRSRPSTSPTASGTSCASSMPRAPRSCASGRCSLRDGRQLDKGGYANLDEFADADIRVYRTLVLRRSPTESRPAVRLPARVGAATGTTSGSVPRPLPRPWRSTCRSGDGRPAGRRSRLRGRGAAGGRCRRWWAACNCCASTRRHRGRGPRHRA